MPGLYSTSDGAIAASSTAGDSAVDFAINTAKKGVKTRNKIKEDTDGIDAVDERDDDIGDRLSEGFEMMHGD